MRLLDELQMNAIPAFQTIFFDGWVLRFADGYTSNRANSVNPIYESTENIQDKIEKCEAIFRRNISIFIEFYKTKLIMGAISYV